MKKTPERTIKTICLLGFGEVGQVLAADLGRQNKLEIRAYDTLFRVKNSLPSTAIKSYPAVKKCVSARQAASGCDLIISAVTAAEALQAAQSVASVMLVDGWYMDLNSISPASRLQAAELVSDKGGRYVETAIMAPIEPKRIAAGMLMGGPDAAEFLRHAAKLGFVGATVFSNQVGPASATKMCRSVIIKGLESLLTESLLTARHYGVDAEVIESLRGLVQIENWPEQSHYMISRSIQHGARRAAEMREVASTVSAAGIEPLMSTACADRQQWAASFGSANEHQDLRHILDAMLDSIEQQAGARPQRKTA